jgi:hypothetical protein
MPTYITVLFKINPIMSELAYDVAVPNVKYEGLREETPLLAYGAFWYTSNLGIIDRGKDRFIAATSNKLSDEYLNPRFYGNLYRIATTSTGDAIATTLTDKIYFYRGKNIFEAIEAGLFKDKDLHKVPIDEKEGNIEIPAFTGNPTDRTAGVDIQPIVYFVQPQDACGMSVALGGKEEIDCMIFSRIPIKEIKVFIDDKETEVAPVQKQDRFWEYVIDSTKEPFKNASHIKFEIHLKNGAIINPYVPPVDLDIEGVLEAKEENPGGIIYLRN